MIRKNLIIVSLITAFFNLNIFCQNKNELWPELKPYKTGYIKVSKIHEIFYQLGGNPEGKPVMVLHGGPGGSCMPFHFRYFNPKKFHIILHDQRGAGRSKPYASLKENTTSHLVEDIEKLRIHFNLGKIILFGGSWGSTLALAYAEKYPQNVKGMIIRGIFTATKEEIDHFYHGGTAKFFPENYNKLVTHIGTSNKKNIPSILYQKLKSLNPETQKKYARIWAKYEFRIALLEIPESRIDAILSLYNPYAFSLIENYYMANGCFLEEGQLIDNVDKLKNIRTIIVNGRYDIICPPITAYKLHKKLSNSELIIVERAGHAESDPPVQAQLIKAVKKFE